MSEMNTKHYDPHGHALNDYFNGNTAATIAVYGDNGELLHPEVPLALFFRTPEEFPPLERKAVELCRGRVLEFGAGTGCHSLAIQERGLDVCAIDFLPACVEIARHRGVRDTRLADIRDFDDGPFDTLLSLMNGLAIVPNLGDLEPFLEQLRRLVNPGGQLLIDSSDLRKTGRYESKPESETDTVCFHAEVKRQLEYKGRRGLEFSQLYVNPETLFAHAVRAGWTGRLIDQDETGRFLAQLERKDG